VASVEQSLEPRAAFLERAERIFDEQDRVLRHDAHQHQDANGRWKGHRLACGEEQAHCATDVICSAAS